MNGAESLARTLVAGGVNVCFTNPGTSEMHFVAALDKVDGIRCVLGLFEGVVTGAADGYWRMAERPAATLLHLGPGPRQWPRQPPQRAQGQLRHRQRRGRARDLPHQARRAAHVGHRGHRAPRLGLGAHVAERPHVAADGAAAIAAARGAARPGRDADPARRHRVERGRRRPAPASRRRAARARGRRRGDRAAAPRPCARASRPCSCSPVRPCASAGSRWPGASPPPPARASWRRARTRASQRGAGRVPVERLPYPVDQALAVLKDVRHLILVGAKAPVAFFAYPDKPSVLTPDGCEIHRLSDLAQDSIGALECAGGRGGGQEERRGRAAARPPRPAERAPSRPRRWRWPSARSCPKAPSSPTSR